MASPPSRGPVVVVRGLSTVRLDKFLVDVGAATSRAHSVALVRSGRVTVDGTVTRSGKLKIDREASRVACDGRSLGLDSPGAVPLLCAYHKPLGVHSTMRDHRARRDLGDALAGAPAAWRRALHPVGRLDADTTGLLLFSSNGDLTHRLLHPGYAVEKEYVADCDGAADLVDRYVADDAAALHARLSRGVATTVGTHAATLLEARLRRRRRGDPPQADDDGATLANHDDDHEELLEVRLVVAEGKHRMVRRMLYNVGLPVVHLRRERFGPVVLRDLPVGAFRPVADPAVVAWARTILAAERADRPPRATHARDRERRRHANDPDAVVSRTGPSSPSSCDGDVVEEEDAATVALAEDDDDPGASSQASPRSDETEAPAASYP